jgi:hypothetical protein
MEGRAFSKQTAARTGSSVRRIRTLGSVSRNSSCIAQFPNFALNNSLELINPGGESGGVCFPGDTFAEFDHPVTIFWRHGSVHSKPHF